MLWGMPMADERAPATASSLDLVALDDAAVGKRELRHELGVPVARRAHARGALLVEAILAKDREHGLRRVPGARAPYRMRRQVFPLRRPELRAIARAEPRGVARVVGVIVRQHHTPHVPLAKDFFPQR